MTVYLAAERPSTFSWNMCRARPMASN